MKGTYEIVSSTNPTRISSLTVYIRLSYFGKSIITEIERYPNRVFNIREETCSSAYQCLELKREEYEGGCWGASGIEPPINQQDIICLCNKPSHDDKSKYKKNNFDSKIKTDEPNETDDGKKSSDKRDEKKNTKIEEINDEKNAARSKKNKNKKKGKSKSDEIIPVRKKKIKKNNSEVMEMSKDKQRDGEIKRSRGDSRTTSKNSISSIKKLNSKDSGKLKGRIDNSGGKGLAIKKLETEKNGRGKSSDTGRGKSSDSGRGKSSDAGRENSKTEKNVRGKSSDTGRGKSNNASRENSKERQKNKLGILSRTTGQDSTGKKQLNKPRRIATGSVTVGLPEKIKKNTCNNFSTPIPPCPTYCCCYKPCCTFSCSFVNYFPFQCHSVPPEYHK